MQLSKSQITALLTEVASQEDGFNELLRMSFESINLPDSNSNEAASHGFIQFRIHTRPGLGLGTVLPNKAYIYFDFNEAIITNTASTAVVGVREQTRLMARTFPNPSTNWVQIELPEAMQGKYLALQVRDAWGRVVLSQSPAPAASMQKLEVASWPAGTYTLEYAAPDGSICVAQLQVLH